jgi:phage terminase large subunit
MESTTALRKIASLRKRIRVVQGGQGAGKTIAILIILINHAAGNPRKEIYIISQELSKMRDTVLKDCISVLQEFGLKCTITGHISGQPRVDFPNGSFIRFLGLDKDDIGKGLRSDVVFFNEANKMGFEGYREASARAKNVYLDFNPNANFWAHEEVIPRKDADFIKLTFKDNEFIPQSEYEEIMYYYEKGFDADGNEVSRYWANKWRVYGLGEVGILEGAVFENWEEVPQIPEEAKLLGYGLDFGYVAPAALVAVYKMDEKYYLDEVIYESKLSNQDLAEIMEAHEIGGEIIYADYAEPKSIEEIRRYGINIHPCESKQDIRPFGIKALNNDTFYVTAGSTNLIDELLTLVWDKDSKGIPTGKPRKGNDHACDAIIYFVGTEGKYDGSYR